MAVKFMWYINGILEAAYQVKVILNVKFILFRFLWGALSTQIRWIQFTMKKKI